MDLWVNHTHGTNFQQKSLSIKSHHEIWSGLKFLYRFRSNLQNILLIGTKLLCSREVYYLSKFLLFCSHWSIELSERLFDDDFREHFLMIFYFFQVFLSFFEIWSIALIFREIFLYIGQILHNLLCLFVTSFKNLGLFPQGTYFWRSSSISISHYTSIYFELSIISSIFLTNYYKL